MTPAKKRRTYGSGGIIQRHTPACPKPDPATKKRPDHKCAGLYVGRAYTGRWVKGERERVEVSGKTKAVVEGKLRNLTRQIREGNAPTPGKTNTTVEQWSRTWLPRHARTARPKYYANDASQIHRWIIPTVGHRRLASLTPEDVYALREAVTKPDPPKYPTGRSTTTARSVHALFLRMLKDAKLEGHPVDERLLLTKRPGKARNDRTAMTVPELLRVLDVIRRRPDKSRWLAALLTGTRRGETVGLTWACLDLERRQIDVSWQLQPLNYNTPHDRTSGFRVPDGHEARHLIGAMHLTRPKTSAGQRIIPIVRWLGEALEETRQAWVPNPWDLVWTDTLRSGEQRPIPNDKDLARWHAIQAEAGVAHPSGRPYHLHETRHSVVSMLLANKVDRSVIEAIVGQAKLVEEYAHVNTEQQLAALEMTAGRLRLGQATNEQEQS